MTELIPAVAGLVALYDSGPYKSGTPVVGYIKSDTGDLVAAIVGDGGKVVPVTKIRGFCGTRWASSAQVVDVFGEGNSVFERVFGRKG